VEKFTCQPAGRKNEALEEKLASMQQELDHEHTKNDNLQSRCATLRKQAQQLQEQVWNLSEVQQVCLVVLVAPDFFLVFSQADSMN
jgi:predicted RNase H-like nuclease (RuvC/YqgF family)